MPSLDACTRAVRIAALLIVMCAAIGARAGTVIPTGPISLTPTEETVFSHAQSDCGQFDFSDVPVRPFQVGPRREVLWFASNSHGNLQTRGSTGGADILAGMQRVGCLKWLTSRPYDLYPGDVPSSYHAGLWMVAPFTPDGRRVVAIVHDEFHGEWSGLRRYCNVQNRQTAIVEYCDYWNTVGAYSADAGSHFALSGLQADGTVRPTIASAAPYQFDPTAPNTAQLPQGITAQSNIMRWGDYHYILVEQIVYGADNDGSNGTCIFRTSDPTNFESWRGWSGATKSYSVAPPTAYPAMQTLPYCTPVLPSYYRFSWSYNTVLKALVIIGTDSCATIPPATSCSPAAPVPAFVYTLATLSTAGVLSPVGGPGPYPEYLLRTVNGLAQWQADKQASGQIYPSVLDPLSPSLSHSVREGPSDRNFQFTGAAPYLYYTRLNPILPPGQTKPDTDNRDVVREALTVTAP